MDDVTAVEGVEGQEGLAEAPQQVQQEMIPKVQYDKVWGKYQTYHKEFGKPEEVRSKLQKLQQYEEALEKYRSGQGSGEDLGEIRKRLRQVEPGLEELGKLPAVSKELAELAEAVAEIRMEKASNYFSKMLEKSGLSLTQDEQEDFEDFVMSKMEDEQIKAFRSGDFSVLDEVVKNLPKTGLYGRLTAKPTPPKPLSRMGSQGSPQPANESKPDSMKEAHKIAWERLNQKE